jgi:hypothetical protein
MMALPDPFDLFATLTVIDVRAAGGFLQDGDEASAQVYLEVEASAEVDGPAATFRFTMDLDQLFALMARLEHAGKTALMMPLD